MQKRVELALKTFTLLVREETGVTPHHKLVPSITVAPQGIFFRHSLDLWENR